MDEAPWEPISIPFDEIRSCVDSFLADLPIRNQWNRRDVVEALRIQAALWANERDADAQQSALLQEETDRIRVAITSLEKARSARRSDMMLHEDLATFQQLHSAWLDS